MNSNCIKVKYADKKAADDDILRIRKKSTRAKIPTRSYLCTCGSWHLTSQKENIYEKNKRLENEIKTLEAQYLSQKQENEQLKNGINKEASKAARIDQRIIELNKGMTRLNKELKAVRSDRNSLISQIIQLKKKLEG